MADLRQFDESTTQDLIRMVRMYRAGQLFGGSSMQGLYRDNSNPVYFRNVSGETMPPYGCGQVTGTEEIGGQNYLQVEKPADTTGEAGWFVFNGAYEVLDDDTGVAQPGPVYRGFKDSGTSTAGESWSPTSGQWYLTQDDSGLFVMAGDDDVSTDVVRVFLGAGSAKEMGIRHFEFDLIKSDGSDGAANPGSGTFQDFTQKAPIITSPISLVADSRSGAPANAQMLRFASAGEYSVSGVVEIAFDAGNTTDVIRVQTLVQLYAVGLGGVSSADWESRLQGYTGMIGKYKVLFPYSFVASTGSANRDYYLDTRFDVITNIFTRPTLTGRGQMTIIYSLG